MELTCPGSRSLLMISELRTASGLYRMSTVLLEHDHMCFRIVCTLTEVLKCVYE